MATILKSTTFAMASMETPCRNICELDHREVCIGCGRTLSEIAAWSRFSDAQRAAIMQRLASDAEEIAHPARQGEHPDMAPPCSLKSA